jgi:hypothetical protein
MNYLFLAYGDEQWLDALSPGEREAFEIACTTQDEVLRKSGYLIAVQPLQSSRTATTVRARNGKVSLSDGPYAQTKEQLIRLFFVDARDLNEAIRVASTMPQARGGAIEVRPVNMFDWMQEGE